MEIVNGKLIFSNFDDIRGVLFDPSSEVADFRENLSIACRYAKVITVATGVVSVGLAVFLGIRMIISRGFFTPMIGSILFLGNSTTAVLSYDLYHTATNVNNIMQSPISRGFVAVSSKNLTTTLFDRTILLGPCVGDAVKNILDAPKS